MKQTQLFSALVLFALSSTTFASTRSAMSVSSMEISAIVTHKELLEKLEKLGGNEIENIGRVSNSKYYVSSNKCSVETTVNWGYPNGETINGFPVLPQITDIVLGEVICE